MCETWGFVGFVAALGMGIWGFLRLLKSAQAGKRGYGSESAGPHATFLTGSDVPGTGGE